MQLSPSEFNKHPDTAVQTHELEQEEMGERVVAAFKAALCYALTYALVVHFWVALKWETTELEELIAIHTINPPLPQIPPPLEGVPSISATKRMLYGMDESQKKLKELPEVDKIMDDYTALFKNFEYWLGDDNKDITDESPLLPQRGRSIKLISTLKVLNKPSLSEFEDEKLLNVSIYALTRELKGISDKNAGFAWDVIKGLLVPCEEDKPRPKKLKLTQEDIYNESCMLSPLDPKEEREESEDDDQDSADDKEDEDSDEEQEKDFPMTAMEEGRDQEKEKEVYTSYLLAEDDLETHYLVIQGVLGQRNESLKDYLRLKGSDTVTAAFGDAVALLEQDIADAHAYAEESLGEAKARQEEQHHEAAAVAQMVEEIDCVSREYVQLLLEAGLGALERKEDLRAALLGTVKELDPPLADGLILDADFYTEPPIPKSSPSQPINIQRLIDTPLLPLLVNGLDLAISTALDLEPELERNVENFCGVISPGALANGQSPGQILTDYVLQLAGKAKFPLPEKARQLLLQSPEGQKVLQQLATLF